MFQLNKTVLTEWSLNNPDFENATLLRKVCKAHDFSNTSNNECKL
jgi:hypothetical protein